MEEILIRVLKRKATPEEAETVLRWRGADPENEREWQEITRVWEAARLQAPEGRRRPPSAFEIIGAAKERRLAAGRAVGSWRLWVPRVAAAIALVAVGFATAMLRSPPALLAGGIVSTSVDEMATVTLADGTLVRLGPNSEFRFGDDPSRREVWLEGEAFFSVAHQNLEPFTVRTAAGKAVVLGTRFRVRTAPDTMRVSIIEGRVEVSSGAGSRELVGGEVGEVTNSTLSVRKLSGSDEIGSGLGNFLAFRSTPLGAVLEEVSAHFDLPVQIRDPRLAGQTVTASFQDASFAEVISVICRITVARCTVTNAGATVGDPVVE